MKQVPRRVLYRLYQFFRYSQVLACAKVLSAPKWVIHLTYEEVLHTQLLWKLFASSALLLPTVSYLSNSTAVLPFFYLYFILTVFLSLLYSYLSHSIGLVAQNHILCLDRSLLSCTYPICILFFFLLFLSTIKILSSGEYQDTSLTESDHFFSA